MGVKNVSRNTLIAASSKVADSILARAVGLMFSKPTETAMILSFPNEKAVSLHMFFVFFPIDVLFVDGSMRVVELVKSLAPFTTYSARQKAKFAVELPAGSIAKSKTRIGDQITFLKVVEKKIPNGRSITVSQA